jgi:hypothetical protein
VIVWAHLSNPIIFPAQTLKNQLAHSRGHWRKNSGFSLLKELSLLECQGAFKSYHLKGKKYFALK